ncbi:nitrous oxide reductase accessory protein NosL [Candidatus Thiodiazotropha endoloripes]|uniref:Nitrous oxide reductase accessory protein NosL n=1 Tax=Candidatus Thiodiazotropha endoloripes TaxID=1818881 RepID=A0A1E2UH30_9GAMM|nr:nitrous oxide reductase accessory protein NosL [Candidatus Thiodiazotropha endoloripes]ODB82529.1 nitrous oxide reductase accessory protein NosL [Candidatus Thiodiazotropha endoloripes]ODB91978.1 nitrous oxide reductase accessory protein NosL [Candidatus Thiodiazotropha endoloripes]ODB94658.1 nitrous oxide reductase accessory protein NosL [Candidatus Thiodiazotropha endoloripes]
MKRLSVMPLMLAYGLTQVSGLQAQELPDPGPKDTCPVCGMFVAKYPEWIGTVLYMDGHAHHFDGAKDLFKYLHDLQKWAPNHQASEIDRIAVTEYYSLGRIDARSAFYVIGSDVLGPMGHELIPLESLADAEAFLQDHQGVAILKFDQVDKALLLNLDVGVFE